MLSRSFLSLLAACSAFVAATPIERRDVINWPSFCDVSNSSATCKLPTVPIGGIDGLLHHLDPKICTKFGSLVLCKKDICPWASPVGICLQPEKVGKIPITWPPDCLVCGGDKLDLPIPKDFISTAKDLVSTPVQLKERSPQLVSPGTTETEEATIVIIWG